METPSSTQSITDFWSVLTESKRIVNAHSRHFLALSVLFLLPLSFSLTVFPTLLHTVTSPAPNRIVSLLRISSLSKTQSLHLHPSLHNPNHTKILSFAVLFASLVVILSLLGVASITYSVYHGFYGRPVKIWHAIRSLKRSFFGLLGTLITAQLVVLVIFVLFSGLWVVGTKGFELIFGGLIDYDSPYVVGVAFVLFGLFLVKVSVDWALVNAVVVVESRWGFETLVRSKGLVRGMRWVALCLIMFFGVFAVVLLWISRVAGADDGSFVSDNGWEILGFVLRIVATSAVLTLLLLHSIAATTVLYMYCKALHGELAGEIAHEFAAEYVSLPFDDHKVPHVVCYVY